MSTADSELFANYWNSYFSWRTGQLDDATITDVVRSIREHVNLSKVANEEMDRLKKLARMIDEELALLDDDDEITWVA